jgi:predicted amidophosphoribosyltransferase
LSWSRERHSRPPERKIADRHPPRLIAGWHAYKSRVLYGVSVGVTNMPASVLELSGSMAATLISRLEQAGHELGNLLFPPTCGLCGAADPGPGQDLCHLCVQAIERARQQPYCRRCGTSVGPFGGTDAGCPACRSTRVPSDGFTRVAEFSGPLADLLRRFKFRGDAHLDRCHGRLLADAIRTAPWCNAIDLLAAVPTCWQHRWRLANRFHATTAMAPHVARETGLPFLPVLQRVRGGPHQVGLPRSARIENAKGKFAAVPGLDLAGCTVCLCDDVATTGATVFECARALRRANAARVYIAVIAHAGGLTTPARDV